VAFGKFGVRSRRELVAAMLTGRPDSSGTVRVQPGGSERVVKTAEELGGYPSVQTESVRRSSARTSRTRGPRS
jgi:hypothetical protein